MTSFRASSLYALAPLWLAFATAQAAPVLSPALQSWVKQHPVQSWAPEADYGPFVYLEGQEARGLSVDFLQLIGKKTGLELRTLPAAALAENLEKVKQKQVDILTSLRPTPERAEILGFTSAYVSIPAILAVTADKKADNTLEKMHGRKVAVGKGYAVERFVREKYPQVTWVAVASDGVGLQELNAGKVDGLVVDAASLEFLQARASKRAIPVAKLGFEYPLSFAFRKDKPELGQVLEAGLRSISVAERDKILAQWMPKPEHKPKNWPVIGASLLLAAGIAISLLLRQRKPAS